MPLKVQPPLVSGFGAAASAVRDSLVVRARAVHVRDAVHEERHVEDDGEPQVEVHPEGRVDVLAPVVVRNEHRHPDGEQREHRQEPLLLPHDDPVDLQVAHVDRLALRDHLRVRRQEQPADVREEEAPPCVVRVGIRLRVFVVDSVVVRPGVRVTLRAKKNCSDLEWESTGSFTWPAIVKKNVSSNRSCHDALYALCDHSRCAPAVIPIAVARYKVTTEMKVKRTDNNVAFVCAVKHSHLSEPGDDR